MNQQALINYKQTFSYSVFFPNVLNNNKFQKTKEFSQFANILIIRRSAMPVFHLSKGI